MMEHPRDELAAFALGALDAAEQRRVDAHVAECAACTAETESYRDALAAYAAAAETSAPDLREAIIARERRAAQPARAGRSGSWVDALRRPVPAFVPVFLAVLLVASLAGFVESRREADAYASALAAIPGGRVVSMESSVAASDVRGALVIPQSGSPYVIFRVPPPPAGKAWEAWVLRGDTPIAAGVAAAGGVVTITLTAPFTTGDGVAVTLEQAGGSSKPTTAPVLALPKT